MLKPFHNTRLVQSQKHFCLHNLLARRKPLQHGVNSSRVAVRMAKPSPSAMTPTLSPGKFELGDGEVFWKAGVLDPEFRSWLQRILPDLYTDPDGVVMDFITSPWMAQEAQAAQEDAEFQECLEWVGGDITSPEWRAKVAERLRDYPWDDPTWMEKHIPKEKSVRDAVMELLDKMSRPEYWAGDSKINIVNCDDSYVEETARWLMITSRFGTSQEYRFFYDLFIVDAKKKMKPERLAEWENDRNNPERLRQHAATVSMMKDDPKLQLELEALKKDPKVLKNAQRKFWKEEEELDADPEGVFMKAKSILKKARYAARQAKAASEPSKSAPKAAPKAAAKKKKGFG